MRQNATVAIFRHGDVCKNTSGINLLTPFGMKQVRATTQKLAYIQPEQIFYSGEDRTLQCATIAQDEIRFEGALDVHKGIHYGAICAMLDATYESSLNELGEIIAAGNKIGIALEMSLYAKLMRTQLTKALIEMACEGNAFGFSHSPLASLASPNLDLPYEIRTGDAIIYQVQGGHIISAEYFQCPLMS